MSERERCISSHDMGSFTSCNILPLPVDSDTVQPNTISNDNSLGNLKLLLLTYYHESGFMEAIKRSL